MNTVTITGPGIDGNAIQVNPYFKEDRHASRPTLAQVGITPETVKVPGDLVDEAVSAGNWWHIDPEPNPFGRLDGLRVAVLSADHFHPLPPTADEVSRAEAIARGIAENGR